MSKARSWVVAVSVVAVASFPGCWALLGTLRFFFKSSEGSLTRDDDELILVKFVEWIVFLTVKLVTNNKLKKNNIKNHTFFFCEYVSVCTYLHLHTCLFFQILGKLTRVSVYTFQIVGKILLKGNVNPKQEY